MRFQTALAPGEVEKVFRMVRNGFTKTLTITAASFVRGNAAILATHSDSNDGYSIQHAMTGGNPQNNLFVGIVAEYPDTTIGQTGVWQPEDYGYVQCYGLYNGAVIQRSGAAGTATLSAGALLMPNTGSGLLPVIEQLIGMTTDTATSGATLAGVGGLVVLAESRATAVTSATHTAKVHIRAM